MKKTRFSPGYLVAGILKKFPSLMPQKPAVDTRKSMVAALLSGGPIPSLGIRVVSSIEREDGSGFCYNVTGYGEGSQMITRFLRLKE